MRLEKIRNEKGMTIPELSKLSGVSIRTIVNAERRGDCDVSIAYLLSVVLGVTFEELCSDENV